MSFANFRAPRGLSDSKKTIQNFVCPTHIFLGKGPWALNVISKETVIEKKSRTFKGLLEGSEWPFLLTRCIPPKTSECIPGPASTTWLPCSLVLFPGMCMLAASNFPFPQSCPLRCIPVRVAVSPSECDPWWKVSHLSTYPFPLFLTTFWGHLSLPPCWMLCPCLSSLCV